MIPARNVIDAHAQDLVTNDQLLLPILKTFAKCNHSAHATSNASCLCVVTELSVASNNSNPLFPSIANTPPPYGGTRHDQHLRESFPDLPPIESP